jgi:predicted TIM-barrel fold metal-dependent hydrolase
VRLQAWHEKIGGGYFMYQKGKIIDAHVHLTSLMFPEDIFDPKGGPLDGSCVKIVLEFMDKYGIDQSVGLIAQGISILPVENELLIKIAEALPERFPAVMVGFSQPMEEPWLYDPKQAALELDGYLKNQVVKGLGEFALESVSYMAEWPEIWSRLRPVFEVLAKHNACALFHTGVAPFFQMGGGDGNRQFSRRSVWFANPAFIDDIAVEFPEVPIIIGHSGVQSFFYYGNYADMALTVAARHPNVYLETSAAPFEVLMKAVADPAIGPEKIIFGTDTPAFFNHYTAANGEKYPTYGKSGIPQFTPDHYKYDLQNIERLPISEIDKMKIMGGTISEIFAMKK